MKLLLIIKIEYLAKTIDMKIFYIFQDNNINDYSLNFSSTDIITRIYDVLSRKKIYLQC